MTIFEAAKVQSGQILGLLVHEIMLQNTIQEEPNLATSLNSHLKSLYNVSRWVF